MSSWLTSLPLEDEGYVLIKQCFQDLLCIRYGWKLNRLPIKCECGAHFDIEHALRCKKREICISSPQRTPQLHGQSSTWGLSRCFCWAYNAANYGWIFSSGILDDESIGIFWCEGVYPLVKRYVNMETKRCYECNDNEKKQYNARVLQIEHGSSPQITTSLVNRKISFSLMVTLHMCVWGSRTIYRKDASVLSTVAPDVSLMIVIFEWNQ